MPPTPSTPPRLLSIAGSDSGGGAGIQADLKAFARCGAHGMTAVTAITAQSTTGVSGVLAVPPEMIVDQVRTVAQDIGIDAVKIGMLGSVETVAAVKQALELVGAAPVVLDPVMIAESGATLLDADAIEALRADLLPRATVVTPNIPEARILASDPDGRLAPEQLARAIHALGPAAVVVTGGHGGGRDLSDLYLDADGPVAIPGERHAEGAAHGSGCTHSSVLAAALAAGHAPLDAARRAQEIAAGAVRDGLRDLGAGAGPVDVIGLLAARPGGAALP